MKIQMEGETPKDSCSFRDMVNHAGLYDVVTTEYFYSENMILSDGTGAFICFAPKGNVAIFGKDRDGGWSASKFRFRKSKRKLTLEN